MLCPSKDTVQSHLNQIKNPLLGLNSFPSLQIGNKNQFLQRVFNRRLKCPKLSAAPSNGSARPTGSITQATVASLTKNLLLGKVLWFLGRYLYLYIFSPTLGNTSIININVICFIEMEGSLLKFPNKPSEKVWLHQMHTSPAITTYSNYCITCLTRPFSVPK